MIAEYKLYHGAVLADIVDRADMPVSFHEMSEAGRLLNYVINDNVGMQIKYATQRLRPWPFSFSAAHLDALNKLQTTYGIAFLVLVCHTDGIITVDVEDVLPSLLSASDGHAWLRADRKKHEMYRLYGPQGELNKKFNTTTEPIIDALRSTQGKRLDDLAAHTLI